MYRVGDYVLLKSIKTDKNYCTGYSFQLNNNKFYIGKILGKSYYGAYEIEVLNKSANGKQSSTISDLKTLVFLKSDIHKKISKEEAIAYFI